MKAVRGFTLLEVLVAVALSALVTVLAYSALTSSLNAAEQIEINTARLHDVDKAMQLLERDLSQLVGRKVNTVLQGGEGFVGEGYVDTEPYVKFTRQGWLNPLFRARSQLQRVEYRFSEGSLWRRHWSTVSQASEEEPLVLELFGGVNEMQLRFLDPAQGGAVSPLGGSWQENWVGQSNSPVAVEIVLQLEDMGAIRRLFILPKGE